MALTNIADAYHALCRAAADVAVLKVTTPASVPVADRIEQELRQALDALGRVTLGELGPGSLDDDENTDGSD